MIYHLISAIIFCIVVYYAIIGFVFMHGTKYDYEQSIKNCQELVKIYPDNAIITGKAQE